MEFSSFPVSLHVLLPLFFTTNHHRYTVLDTYDQAPHSVGQTFMPLQPTRWNTLDGAVLNFIDHYDKAVRYRRLHYLFIPPSVSLVRRETDDAALLPINGSARRLPWPTSRDEDENEYENDDDHNHRNNYKDTSRAIPLPHTGSYQHLPSTKSSVTAAPVTPSTTLSWTPSAPNVGVRGASGESSFIRTDSSAPGSQAASKKDRGSSQQSIMEKHLKHFKNICTHLQKMSIGDLDPMTVDVDEACVSMLEILETDRQHQDEKQRQRQGEEGELAAAAPRFTQESFFGPSTMLKLAKPGTTKLRLKGRFRRHPEWIYLEYHRKFRTDRCYRITLQFLVCSGATIQDFCSGLNKLCKKGNTVMMQVPEYTHPYRNPYIHAFFVPLHLPLPLAKDATLAIIVQDAMIFRYGFVLEADVEGSLDARSPPLPPPVDPNVVRGLKGRGDTPPHFGGHKHSRSSMEMNTSLAESQRWAGRQYLHRTGIAFVRILRDGLLWIPNRMTETRERWGEAQDLFIEFREFCTCVQVCYGLVGEVVEIALEFIVT